MHTFKRKLITEEAYLRKLIHYNPIEAGLAQLPEEWKYAFYQTLIPSTAITLLRDEIISYFDDIENFKCCHRGPSNVTFQGF